MAIELAIKITSGKDAGRAHDLLVENGFEADDPSWDPRLSKGLNIGCVKSYGGKVVRFMPLSLIHPGNLVVHAKNLSQNDLLNLALLCQVWED